MAAGRRDMGMTWGRGSAMKRAGFAVKSSRLMAVALAFGFVVACGAPKQKEIKYVETPVEDLYNAAVDEMNKKRFLQAAARFDEVERQHPYSIWARRAMLMAAYSYYESNRYDEAILAANRFIALHPGNRDVAYAYYIIAVSYYEQISDVGRDQKMTQEALKGLEEVVRRFPNSEYARDARLKIDLTQDHLAGKEMDVGRWYLRQDHHLAAINRFRRVVSDFQTTSHVPEALHRLVESYLAMGIIDEAQSSAAVLGHNFPGSRWYEESYDLLVKRDLKPVRQAKKKAKQAKQEARKKAQKEAKQEAEKKAEKDE